MEIRILSQEEKQNTRSLYETVFSEDSQSFVEYYYEEKTKDNTIYVLEEDGKIQTMVHLNPYSIRINEKEASAHYIVAVATREEARRQGFMGKVLVQAMEDLYQNHEPFTFLMPAREGIYTPYGFRTVYTQNVPWLSEEEQIGAYEKAQPEDLEALAAYAKEQEKNVFQVYTEKTASYWERLCKELESDGGYVGIKRVDGKIQDVAYITEEKNPTQGKIMVRIVALESLLSRLELSEPLGICFQVTDPILSGNNQCYVLAGTPISGVLFMYGKEEQSEGTITIEALGRFLFGETTVEELKEEEGVVLSERLEKELKKILPLKKKCINEIV